MGKAHSDEFLMQVTCLRGRFAHLLCFAGSKAGADEKLEFQQGPLGCPSEALTQQVPGTGHVGTCRRWKSKQQHKPSSNLVKIVPCSVLKPSAVCGRDSRDCRAQPGADQSSEGLLSHTDPTSNRGIRAGEQGIKYTPNAKIHPPAAAEPD